MLASVVLDVQRWRIEGKMKTVFVLSRAEYDDKEVLGVSATLEGAKQAAEGLIVPGGKINWELWAGDWFADWQKEVPVPYLHPPKWDVFYEFKNGHTTDIMIEEVPFWEGE